MCIDAELPVGRAVDGSAVHRYTPSGELLAIVEVDALRSPVAPSRPRLAPCHHHLAENMTGASGPATSTPASCSAPTWRERTPATPTSPNRDRPSGRPEQPHPAGESNDRSHQRDRTSSTRCSHSRCWRSCAAWTSRPPSTSARLWTWRVAVEIPGDRSTDPEQHHRPTKASP